MLITTDLIHALKTETTKILSLCNVLNNHAIIFDLNNKVNGDTPYNLLIKAEQFFISDVINAYKTNKQNESPVSRFVLAYYYDAIRNNQFASEHGIISLNKLIATDDFTKHLNKIKSRNTLSVANSKELYYFIPSALTEINHKELDDVLRLIKTFMGYAYDIKFSDLKEFIESIGFNKADFGPKNQAFTSVHDEDTLQKVMEELNELVGLENVKNDVTELINLLEIQKKRASKGLKNIEVSLHAVFLGPPGTGKTSVARLLGRIFKHLGFLTKGQLFQTEREGMVAGFVGQTATKVNKAVEESLGGVMFIDEVYSLSSNLLGNNYGTEAISTLLKRMEDKRDDLVVIVAGYTEPMKIFIESNPGLNSRFNRFFYFKHFTPLELFQIFENFCKKSDFLITEEAKEKLHDTFEMLHAKKDDSFGNARVVRNLFERCVQNQANRIIKLKNITDTILNTFTEDDIPEP